VTDHAAIMKQLGARPVRTRVEPTETALADFERTFDVALPADYRAFLARHGAMRVDGNVAYLEPTPLGTRASIDTFFGFDPDPRSGCDLAWATGIADGKGVAVPIGSTLWGDWFFLDCREGQRGRVALRDAQQRHLWTEESVKRRFREVAPALRTYFEARDRGTLAPPLSGTPGWYLVGQSFDEFLGRVVPAQGGGVA
jgi:hypothetical protein